MRYKYAPTTDGDRLKRQSHGYYTFDISAINEAKGDKKDLIVLDLGCANGELTKSRFYSAEFAKVIGIDISKEAIAEANARNDDPNKFRFYVLDLESDDFLLKLKEIMAENDIQAFDLAFGALIFHHLDDPKKPINALKSVMASGGKVIIRSSDDGGKMCYPHSELLKEILDRYDKIVRSVDRHFGRKLQKLFLDAGYIDVKILYHISDTCNKSIDSRENMFEIGFGYRLKTVDAILSASPSDELKSEREWLKKALDALKTEFSKPDFWYCNTSYIAIAEVK